MGTTLRGSVTTSREGRRPMARSILHLWPGHRAPPGALRAERGGRRRFLPGTPRAKKNGEADRPTPGRSRGWGGAGDGARPSIRRVRADRPAGRCVHSVHRLCVLCGHLRSSAVIGTEPNHARTRKFGRTSCTGGLGVGGSNPLAPTNGRDGRHWIPRDTCAASQMAPQRRPATVYY